MTCGKNNRTMVFFVVCKTANHTIAIKNEARHLGLKMYLATTLQNGVAHVLNDTWQLVRTDVWMGISQNIGRCTMLTEHIENLLNRTTLLATGVELAIRIGTCPTLAKAIVALRVYLLRLGNLRQVFLALMHILTTFQDNGSQTQFYQSQGSKQATRTSTHHNDLWFIADIRIVHRDVFIILRLFVDIHAYFQIDKDGALTGIDAATQDAHTCYCTNIESVLICQP